jgi:single-strand DNA-binding protein
MAERDRHPEIDIQTPARALIGAEPISQPDPVEDVRLSEVDADTSLAPQSPVVDIPSLVRLFQTDAYPLPEGAPLQIAVGKETSLTLFPQDEALEYRQQTPEHTIYLRTSKRGELTFSFRPTPPVVASQEPSLTPPQNSFPETVPVIEEALQPIVSELAEPAQKPDPVTPRKDQAGVASGSLTSPDATGGKETKERMVITGRVGREPTIKQIKRGLMAKFPVAEHRPDGATTWHTIVAFGKTAESLRDSLTKGQMVTVGGYPHQREITGKAGQTRTVTEVYLAGLKRHK